MKKTTENMQNNNISDHTTEYVHYSYIKVMIDLQKFTDLEKFIRGFLIAKKYQSTVLNNPKIQQKLSGLVPVLKQGTRIQETDTQESSGKIFLMRKISEWTAEDTDQATSLYLQE